MQQEIPVRGTDLTPRTTIDISDIGGSYEWFCQRMLEKGIEWLDTCTLDDDTRTELISLISLKGCSGAQVGAVMSHLWRIEKDGYEEWLQYIAASDGTFTRIFEFDGSLECLQSLNQHSVKFMKELYGADWADTVPDEI